MIWYHHTNDNRHLLGTSVEISEYSNHFPPTELISSHTFITHLLTSSDSASFSYVWACSASDNSELTVDKIQFFLANLQDVYSTLPLDEPRLKLTGVSVAWLAALVMTCLRARWCRRHYQHSPRSHLWMMTSRIQPWYMLPEKVHSLGSIARRRGGDGCHWLSKILVQNHPYVGSPGCFCAGIPSVLTCFSCILILLFCPTSSEYLLLLGRTQ